MDFGCGGRAEKGGLVNWARPIWFVGVSCPQIAFYPRLFIRHTNLHFDCLLDIRTYTLAKLYIPAISPHRENL